MSVAIKNTKDKVERKLKVVEDKHMDWETFQMSAVYIVGIMSNVAEHQDVGNNTPNREPNNSTANNSITRPWNTQLFSRSIS